MRRRREEIPPGTLLRKEMLGSVAVYEVVRSTDELVEVKVMGAPGLAPGRMVMLTRAAVDAMQRIERGPEHPGGGDDGNRAAP